MTQQVSGSEKTLLVAIRDGEIERPVLMRWNAWQQWRSGAGMRPTLARDAVATTNTEESALWKAVMCEFYGTEWSLTLAAAEDEAETVAPAAAASAETQQPTEPSLEPAGGAGQLTPRPAPSIERSPGSGEVRTGAAGPGSGRGTPDPSWSSQDPGTPTRLNTAIVKPFAPATEVLERYLERTKKQAKALSALGEPLGDGVLEALLAKATYENKIHEEAMGDALR